MNKFIRKDEKMKMNCSTDLLTEIKLNGKKRIAFNINITNCDVSNFDFLINIDCQKR